MGRLVRGFVIVTVIIGLALAALRRFGLLGGGECSPSCACSVGATECRCGHLTCLSPAA